MKAHSGRVLSLIMLAVLMAALVVEDAEAARRSGLAGNLLIKDADDVFIFPQYNVAYANRLIVDMGTVATSGSGTLIFGKESWGLNFSTHRSDFLNGVVAGYWGGNDRGLFGPQFSPSLTGPSDPTQGPDDVQWFDVGFGWGDETPIGFRAGIGLDADKTEVTGVPDTKNGANVFSIQGGITFNETTDVTAEVSIGTSEADSLDGSVNQFAAGIRGYYEMAEMEWGYLGAVAVAGEDEDITPTSKNENSITQFMAGWGPVWNDESEDWQAAGYMTVEVQSQKFEPFGPDNNQDDRFVTFPGFRFAGEHRLKSWLWVRGGARSDYFWHRTEDEGVPVPGSSTETKNRLYDFQWTAGVSAEWGGFRFDGAINEPWVNNGPSFIGQDSQLFAFASATYNWGGEPESR